jgi:hypothetical protein
MHPGLLPRKPVPLALTLLVKNTTHSKLLLSLPFFLERPYTTKMPLPKVTPHLEYVSRGSPGGSAEACSQRPSENHE